MSEQSEHTSEEADGETNAMDQSNEQSKCEESMLNNETEAGMLEDEEMPTYISVSTPSRRDESDTNNTKQERIPTEEDHSRSPCPSDDQGADSIYVLSSGEDSDHPPFNDEEDDEYGDSDELGGIDMQKKHVRTMMENYDVEEEEEEEEEEDDEGHPLKMQDDDDEEEDDDDEDNDDEEIDGGYELQVFDRASDDFILNHRLKNSHKERSLSLQDLSVCKNNIRSPYNKKRHSLNISRQNYLGSQQNPIIYPVTNRKQSMPLRYRNVESKVKRYIKDIKDLRRQSMERRIKDQEYMITKNHMDSKNPDSEELKQAITTKTIKDYAEKAIKDLQHDEGAENGRSVYNSMRTENGECDKINLRPMEDQNKYNQKVSELNPYYEPVQNEKIAKSNNDKTEKRNGSVDINAHNMHYQGMLNQNTKFNDVIQPSILNGHQQTPTLQNLRTLSYEEYMHGSLSTGQIENLNRHTHTIQEEGIESDMYSTADVINTPVSEDTNVPCSFKIENVKSIRIMQDESKQEAENINLVNVKQDGMNFENSDVSQLKNQLSQKTTQYNTLRDAYQKTLSENLRMKQELDALKKSLAKYETENKSCDTKTASVQTEHVVEPVLNKEPITEIKDANKISTSSVASTISSIDQWADSACSPAISIKPPDLTTILNSDDSMVLTDSTPRKTARTLSRAFITSSRILQTLSTITQSKVKPESPLVRSSTKKLNENLNEQLLNPNFNSPIQASSAKKRKATDMLGTTTSAQPFKIPHTVIDFERKNIIPNIDEESKHNREHTKPKSEQQRNTIVTDENNSKTGIPPKDKSEETDSQEDNVKCFIYREDENSKDNSFLIQTEEPTKDGLINEKGRIRECGPYLLGNVEVRMSEVNGTISIWGKEVSQESTAENEEETEVVTKTTEKKSCPCWQKTPQTRFNGSPIICSTGRKSKIPPRFRGSNCSQCARSPLSSAVRTTLLMDDIAERRHSNPVNTSLPIPRYKSCDLGTHCNDWQTCKQTSASQENIHSCCTHHIEYAERDCNCTSHLERHKSENIHDCSKSNFNVRTSRTNSCKNAPEPKHLHESITNLSSEDNEETCKCNPTYRCTSLQNTAENYQQNSKCSHALRSNSTRAYKSSSTNTSNRDYTDRNSCNHSPSHTGDEDFLIPHKRGTETPETRQRRLSGKRVRGILMDLLKGCGDCRNTSINSGSKARTQEKDVPYLINGSPQITISPCTASEPSCSNTMPAAGRCCHAYARRIESQLEEFRMEMERVRSRSDAILEMLSMLHSVDMN